MTNKNIIEYSIDKEKSVKFFTTNQVFSPNAIDKGTLAMMRNISITNEDKVLDLGCGYGFVGVYVYHKYHPHSITMVDINKGAVDLSKDNVALNNVKDVDVIKSDGFEKIIDKEFTLILSNPPYHTDFKVAKGFIENGFKTLTIGGKMVMVVKRLLWYKNKMSAIFGGVQVISEEDGYYVLVSQKRTNKSPKKKEKKVSKKHQQKIDKSNKRKRRLK